MLASAGAVLCLSCLSVRPTVPVYSSSAAQKSTNRVDPRGGIADCKIKIRVRHGFAPAGNMVYLLFFAFAFSFDTCLRLSSRVLNHYATYVNPYLSQRASVFFQNMTKKRSVSTY